METIELKLDLKNHEQKDFSSVYKILVDWSEARGDCPALLLLDDVPPMIIRYDEDSSIVILNRTSCRIERDLKKVLRKSEEKVEQNLFEKLKEVWHPSLAYKVWYRWLLEICSYLKIETPAVYFTKKKLGWFGSLNGTVFPGGDKPYATDVFITVDENNILYAVKILLHELRHVWQHKYHNDMFDGYFSFKRENSEQYYMQKAEIDADAFAYWVLEENGVKFILEDLGEKRCIKLREQMEHYRNAGEKAPVLFNLQKNDD